MDLKEFFRKKLEKPYFKFWLVFGVIKLVILLLLIVFFVVLFRKFGRG